MTKTSTLARRVLGSLMLLGSLLQAQVVQKGQGSYTTNFPGTDAAGRNGYPSGTPFVTGNAANKPVPTNEWWSHKVKNAHSSNLFNYPFTLKTINQGLVATYIPWGPIDNIEPVQIGLTGLNASAANVADHDDWMISLDWQSGTHHLQARTGIGMPFLYFNKDANSTVEININQGAVTDSGSFLIVKGVRNGADFVIYGPSGSSWQQNGSTYTSSLNGNDYWSLLFIPPGGNPDQKASDLKKYAFVFPKHCQADWQYNEQTSIVHTDFTVQTEVMEGNDSLMLQGLLPHHWSNLAGSSQINTSYVYSTVRGDLKLMEGNHFAVENTFYGILPTLPNVHCHSISFDPGKLQEKVDLLKNEGLATWTDSYNEGQAMNRLIQTARIAEQVGDTSALNSILKTVKERLEDWLSYQSGEVAFLFYYNQTWDALIGYPAGHGQDANINDHHFHWGYFIHAASFVEQFEPGWAANWGPMIDMLVRDAASSNRSDNLFPYLRNFSPYAGHCWANGFASFPQGNDQESTSESMQFNSSLIHWGAVTGNDSIRDLGIYLYTTEQSAVEEYWFDMYQRNFGANQQYSLVSRVWGNSYDNGTFWTADIAASYGIELYPIHGGSLYLGHNLNYHNTLWSEIEQNTGILSNAPNVNLWHDVMWQYLAFSDPDKALNLYDSYPNRALKFGVSDAQTYYWLHSLKVLGAPDATVTADHPLAAAFQGDGNRIYVAQNYGSSSLNVQFSDGYQLTVAPGELATSMDVNLEGELSTLFDRAYTWGTAQLSFNLQQGNPDYMVLYQNEDSITSLQQAPYQFTVDSLEAGIHSFYVQMYQSGNCAISNLLKIVVGEQVPFSGSPALIPGSIWPAEYDLFEGGFANEISYLDLSPDNQGDFRLSEWVDATNHPSEGPVVGWLNAGEWLEFTVDVQTAGLYDVDIRYASDNSAGGGPMRLESDGQIVASGISFNQTGGWDTWATKSISNVPLKSGEQILRIYIENGEFNLGELDFQFKGPLAYDQPVADAGPVQMIVWPQNQASLDGSASFSPASNPLTYQWTQLYGPSAASPGNATMAISSLQNLQKGVYKYRLEVDNGTHSDQDEVYVIVGDNSNVPPTAAFLSPAQGSRFVEGETILLQATANDLNDSIQKLDFYLNGQLFQSFISRPYNLNWTAQLGPAQWRLLAYDYLGDSAWSAPLSLQIDTAPSCEGTSHNGDFSWKFSSDDSNPTLTFIPSQAGVGVPTCILYYGTNPGALPGYPVTPNQPYQLNANKGDLIYFYYTYSYPGAGERNNSANKDSYVVGTCSDIGLMENWEEQIAVYPNPSTDQFYIDLIEAGAHISVYDLRGKLILEKEVQGRKGEINLEGRAGGLYFLKLNKDGKSATFKIVLRKY